MFHIIIEALLIDAAFGLTAFNENDDLIQTISIPAPPDHKKLIAMARYVVHQTDWAAVATISQIKDIHGFPFANIVSMADGPVDNSTGIPFFYLTPLDFTSIDLDEINKCTVTVSLEQTGYCREEQYEPDDPRCSRIMLSGSIIKVENDTAEKEFIKNALFSRHPGMKRLPADHEFYFAKLDIKQVVMLDWFGGPSYLNIQDYLSFQNNILYQKYPLFGLL